MRHLALILALAVTPDVAAQPWKIFATVDYVEPTEVEKVGRISFGALDTYGWSFGAEWRFSVWGGFAADYSHADDYEIEFNGQVFGVTSASQITGALNMHLIDTDHWDLHFGPTLSYVRWNDLDRPGKIPNLDVDNEWAVGIQAGLDYRVYRSLWVVGGLRYSQLDVQRSTGSVGVDPLIARVGLAVRF